MAVEHAEPIATIPRVGATIGGKYRLVRRLGEGGMGTVFEAVNLLTHKRVAIKWMHTELEPHPDHAARIIREAQAAARVRHPNVVDVFDVGRDGSSLFLVMEMLDGETLTRLLSRGGLSIPGFISLVLPAMRGVAAAHKAGVIHRDIKPDNIFLSREGDGAAPVPKVLDFGISKLEPRSSEREALSLTRTGTTFGTPLYMSCEHLANVKDVDERTDVYAFGVILYQALTGRAPFAAETVAELAIKIATTTAIAPIELRPEIPASLDKLIQGAIARSRDDRVSSIDDFVAALEPFADEQSFRAQMGVPSAALPNIRPASGSLGAAGLNDRDSSVATTVTRTGTFLATALRDSKRLIVALTATGLLVVGVTLHSSRSAESADRGDVGPVFATSLPPTATLVSSPVRVVSRLESTLAAAPVTQPATGAAGLPTARRPRALVRRRPRPGATMAGTETSARALGRSPALKASGVTAPPRASTSGTASGEPSGRVFRAGKPLRTQF